MSLLSSYPIDKMYLCWQSSLKGLIVGVKFSQRSLSPGREICENQNAGSGGILAGSVRVLV